MIMVKECSVFKMFLSRNPTILVKEKKTEVTTHGGPLCRFRVLVSTSLALFNKIFMDDFRGSTLVE